VLAVGRHLLGTLPASVLHGDGLRLPVEPGARGIAAGALVAELRGLQQAVDDGAAAAALGGAEQRVDPLALRGLGHLVAAGREIEALDDFRELRAFATDVELDLESALQRGGAACAPSATALISRKHKLRIVPLHRDGAILQQQAAVEKPAD